MYKHFDHALYTARPDALDHLSEMLTRCAVKQAWYINKIKK